MGYYDKFLGNPIIVALDKVGKEGAIKTIEELERSVWGFSLGNILVTHGVSLIEEIRERVGSVNLLIDQQFTGTPESIAEYVSTFSPHSSEVGFIVVNANSAPIGIRTAVESARISKILVGSVLDSLGIADVDFLYGTPFREVKAYQFAKMAKEEGAYGFYCSVEDLEFLSHYPELKGFPKIVYGVRPKWDKNHDTHKQVMTPREVMERGATKFVIGATIRKAKDKKRAVERILEEINKGRP